MSSTSNEKKVNMKLMVNKNTKKVIFAEAGQECVEFISQIMSLPLSTVTNILHAKGMLVNPISTLFKSVKSPNDPNRNFESGQVDTSVLNPSPTPVGPVTGGDVIVYMVTDNLDVKPMSMTLIKPYVNRIGVLEEKIVQVGSQEALAILKASFETNDVLTNVFLGKKTGGSRLYPSTIFRKVLYLLLVFAFIGMLGAEMEKQGKRK